MRVRRDSREGFDHYTPTIEDWAEYEAWLDGELQRELDEQAELLQKELNDGEETPPADLGSNASEKTGYDSD